jgi:hypothetical protein
VDRVRLVRRDRQLYFIFVENHLYCLPASILLLRDKMSQIDAGKTNSKRLITEHRS